LLDVDADHETALNVVRHARTLSPSLRVVLLTDRAAELADAAQELEPSPLILEKPIDYAELCARLHGDPHARTTSAIVALCPESERATRFGNRG
jgi:DNA-binding response OmpR family regulator